MHKKRKNETYSGQEMIANDCLVFFSTIMLVLASGIFLEATSQVLFSMGY